MHIKHLSCDRIFFTSDTHFGHENIIKYCDRPYDTVGQMDKDIKDRWNSIIPKDGIVFHLGDFALYGRGKLSDYTSGLNGEIYITPGNHDRLEDLKSCNRFTQISDIFDIIVDDEELEEGNQKVTLCHYPMMSWNQAHRGAWQFFGHHHGSFTDNKIVQVDVGVDSSNFTPWTWMKLKTLITKRALKIKYSK